MNKRVFDCEIKGVRPVDIFITDTEGNKVKASTFVHIQDNFDLCATSQALSCINQFIVHHGLAMALSNTQTGTQNASKFVKRVEEDCVGDPVFRYANSTSMDTTFDFNSLGTQTLDIDLVINNKIENQIKSFVNVQDALSTSACIPVPIAFYRLMSIIDSTGMVKINAADFDAGSYTDCGGSLSFSFSSDVMDTDSTFNATVLNSDIALDIWVTDSQTGSQNKVAVKLLLNDFIQPICAAMPPVAMNCSDYVTGAYGASTDVNGNGAFDEGEYAPLTGDLMTKYNTDFGVPACTDNSNGTLTMEQGYQLVTNDCGTRILRRYRAIDASGNKSDWKVQQIHFSATPDWTVTFPANWQGACGNPYQDTTITIQNGTCNALTYTVTEKTVAVTGSCPRLERTFHITNTCIDGAGKDTMYLPNANDGMMISSSGNENLIYITYVQHLSLTDDANPVINIMSPDACISGVDFDAKPYGVEDLTPGMAPYECDELKTWTLSATDNCTENVNITGKLFENSQLVKSFEGASVSYVVEPNKPYRVEYTATDDCGNVTNLNSQTTFKDCVKPVLQLHDMKEFKLAPNGFVAVQGMLLNYESFDNCTDMNDLEIKTWHPSLNSPMPTTLAEIEALPRQINFVSSHVGVQTIHLFVLDEANNWTLGKTNVVIMDDADCSNAPQTLNVEIFSDNECANNWTGVSLSSLNCAGEKTWYAMTSGTRGALTWNAKLFEDDVMVKEVNNDTLTYMTQLNKNYRVEFNVTDACNNTGNAKLIQNFSNCDQAPFVRLVNNAAFTLGDKGVANILAYSLDNGSFDNCTNKNKFNPKIWHSSLGSFPSTLNDVMALGTKLTLNCDYRGEQIVFIFIVDEGNNWAYAHTTIFVKDNMGVCPPIIGNVCAGDHLNLTGSITEDSTYRAKRTITANTSIEANTTVNFHAGLSITLNSGFHVKPGASFTARLQDCNVVEETLVSKEKETEELIKVVGQLTVQSPREGELNLKIQPNPFQSETNISFYLPKDSPANVRLLDILGKPVKQVNVEKDLGRGWHQLQLSSDHIPIGSYYLILEQEGAVKTKKLILMR